MLHIYRFFWLSYHAFASFFLYKVWAGGASSGASRHLAAGSNATLLIRTVGGQDKMASASLQTALGACTIQTGRK